MKKRMPLPNLPEIRCHADELNIILKLFAASDTMDEAIDEMNRRLKAIPNALSGMKMMRGRLNNMLIDLCATLPECKKISILRMSPHMKYKPVCGFQASNLEQNETILTLNDLDILIESVHSGHCMTCIDGNCNSCKYGKCLDRILTYDRERDESWAFYEGWSRNERN